MTNIVSFEDFSLSPSILSAIKQKWFEEPSPIQKQIIPLFLAGKKDIIGQAQTWTGKTASFAIPLLELIDKKKSFTQAIVLTPTRELAIQVAEEIASFSLERAVNICLLYGGQSMTNEIRKLSSGPQIVIGTPWRVKDHIKRRNLKLEHIQYFVLDEADEMLNIGFREEIEEILAVTPKEKRVLLFSATMPKAILAIAEKYMHDYDFISIKKEDINSNLINQIYFEVREKDKLDALTRILDIEDDFFGIVFCRTKRDVDEVAEKLKLRGYLSDALHGDIDQRQREKILRRFKNGDINILVATDVAARGIDVNNLTHVINYNLPESPESYTHRIGRTWRAGKTWTAINLVSRAEYRKLFFIEKITKSSIKKEKIPNVADILWIKKKRFIQKIEKSVKEWKNEQFLDLAKEVLKVGDTEVVLSALLKEFLQDSYVQKREEERDLNEENSREENTNMECRLFLAKWKFDGMTQSKIKDFIKQETNIDLGHIKQIDIYDKFSFLNVPLRDAEVILGIFKMKNKRQPLVVQAKKR